MKPSTIIRAGAVIIAVGLVAACGGGSGGESTTEPAASTAGETAPDSSTAGESPEVFSPAISTQAPAGTNEVPAITWNLSTGEPSSLDPAYSSLENISTVVGPMCESLQRFTTDYAVEPALATSIEHPTPTTWVVNLREGVTFWDGTPMTADDVVFSVNRILNPELGSSWIGWAPQGATVEATDANTVTITIPEYNSMVENFFQTPAFMVVSKAFAEKAGATFGTAAGGIMCTGPYKLGAWDSGQSITLERNDAWWDAAAAPKVASIKFTFAVDPAAQTAGMVSGDINGQFTVPVSAYEQLSQAGNMLFATSLSPTFIATMDTEGPMGDLAVRQALASSIDYAGIVSTIYRDAAAPLRALVPPAAYGYAKDVYQPAYDALPEPTQDLQKAKELAASSTKSQEPLTLAYFSLSNEESKAATAIADSANSIGLNVELKPLDAATYGAIFYSPEARAGIDALLLTGYLDFPDPLQYYQYFAIGSFYNFAGYSNQEYTDLISKALGEADPQKKAEYVVQAQQIMVNDAFNIPVVTSYVSLFYGKELGGYLPAQYFLYTPWAAQLGGS